MHRGSGKGRWVRVKLAVDSDFEFLDFVGKVHFITILGLLGFAG